MGTDRRRARALVPAALALAVAASGCGGAQRPGPPRSSCEEAAASIVRGLRSVAPADADKAAELEPRFVEACRRSAWRPGLVRCFAIARDAAELRVCARRLDRPQRDEASAIQAELYGVTRRETDRGGSVDEQCRRLLGPAIEQLFVCGDQLSPFERLDLRRQVDTIVRSLELAHRDPDRAGDVAHECARLADRIRIALSRAGC